jgi:hypothetical protein
MFAPWRREPRDADGETVMTEMSERILAGLLPASAMALCLGLAITSASARNLPIDRPTDVSGIKVACTGIGNREESEARWSNYPVKIQTVGGYGQYLANENIDVHDKSGAEIADLKCGAPWVLMQLAPGRYHAIVQVSNAPARDVNFSVPESGQRDVIVRFPSLTSGRESSTMSD